jgi:hypothetical protein
MAAEWRDAGAPAALDLPGAKAYQERSEENAR